MKRPLTVPCLLRTKETGCYLPFTLLSHWNWPTTETMKLLQVQDKFGLRGAPAAVMEKRSWHGRSHSVPVLRHWARRPSPREASFALCWFRVAVGFGVESIDHSVSSGFLQEESIWGIKYSKNLKNSSSLSLPRLMELSLQKTSSSFFLPFRGFTKTAEDQNTGKLLLKTRPIPILCENLILSWDIFFLNTFHPSFFLESVYYSVSDSHELLWVLPVFSGFPVTPANCHVITDKNVVNFVLAN